MLAMNTKYYLPFFTQTLRLMLVSLSAVSGLVLAAPGLGPTAPGSDASAIQTTHSAPRTGVHGMLLFSDGQSLFASHLPMFHVPHDVQLLLRLEPKSSVAREELIRQLSDSPGYWTLEPEVMDLNAVTTGNQTFKASLYQGHFERGGTQKYADVRFSSELLFFAELQPEPANELTYRLLGCDEPNASGCFYFLQIQGRPGADQLLRIAPKPGLTKPALSKPGLSKTALPKTLGFKRSPGQTHVTPAQIAAMLGMSPTEVSELYLETGELQ